MHSSLDEHLYEINYKYDLLGIHDLFGTELAMIFSFHVGLTDSTDAIFFPVSVRAFLNSSMDQSVESVFYQNVVILLLLDLC
jgi:hypothetical protein